MQGQDLIKLVDAGFTKDDILRLFGVEAQKPTVEKEVQTEAPKEEAKPAEKDEALKTVLGEIKTTLSDLRKAAIQNDQQPASESVDDILSSMLK